MLRGSPQHNQFSLLMTDCSEFVLINASDFLLRFVENAPFSVWHLSHLPNSHEPVSIRRNKTVDRMTAGSLDFYRPNLSRLADLVDRRTRVAAHIENTAVIGEKTGQGGEH